jgi:hypothetical protein
MSSPFRIPTGQ